MKNDYLTSAQAREKTDMVKLQESFSNLDDSIKVMLLHLPEKDREILQYKWLTIAKNFEDYYSNYFK